MPQFDTSAFFNQLFYLTIIFYSFYMVLFYSYLPGLTRILKVRRKKLELASQQGSYFLEERQATFNGYEGNLTGFADKSRQTLSLSLETADVWLLDLLSSKEQGEFSTSLGRYLELVGSFKSHRVVTSTLLK